MPREKSPATPGIRHGTVRLVAQYLNHYATPGPAHKVGNIIIHRLLQLHSITSLSHRNFHHDQWFRPTKISTCLGIAYVHHRKMCIVWKGQERLFKVMTKFLIPEGSLSLYSRTPLIRINWEDKPSGYA